MSLWGRTFAAVYDRALAASEHAGLAQRRQQLLGDLTGRVIEIGAGTGANLVHYPPALAQLVLLEPEEPMARRLRAKLVARPLAAEVVSAPAEAIPFADASFDAAVATLVLCTVRDQAQALAELRRVLVPGGRLVFIEHVRAEDERLSRWQDRADPLWRRLACGCHCNRSTLAAIETAGFAVERVESGRIPKANAIVRPMIEGVAVAGRA